MYHPRVFSISSPLNFFEFFCRNQLIEFVTGTYFVRFHREMLSFLHGLHGFRSTQGFIKRSEYCSCSGTCNQQLVSHIQFCSFYQELGNTDIRKVSDTLTYIYFPFRSGRSVVLRPLAEALSEIIPIPEATVEYSLQTFIPRGYLFIGKRCRPGKNGWLLCNIPPPCVHTPDHGRVLLS